jgi:hypothetical protein
VTLNNEDSLAVLRRRDFNPMQFIRTIFKNEQLGGYERAIAVELSARSDEQKSFLTKVAENIHNYVKAQDDLLRTKSRS